MNKSVIAAASLSVAALLGAGTGHAADLGLPAPAAPEPFVAAPGGLYVSVFGGANIPTGDDVFTNGITSVEIDRDLGFQVGGAVGYKWSNFNYGPVTPRTEVEFSYFDNSVGELDFSGNAVSPDILVGDTDVRGFNVLGNLYLDFDDLLGEGITPYVVGGVGIQRTNLNLVYAPGVFANLDDSSTNFLWSIGAGGSIDVTDNVSFFADARFQQAVNVDSVRRFGSVPVVGAGGGTFEDDINNVVVRGGLSYRF
ncbi:MAG: outer membrane beta-barrel protein [Pseudomonadota bacterium]